MNKDCERFNDALALGDDATEDEIQFAETHVKTCEECQDVARGFELFLDALTDEEGEEDPPEVQAAILEMARKQAEEFARRRRARARSPIVKRVLVAAGLTGVVAGSFFAGQSTGGDPVAIRLRYAETEFAAQHFEHVQAALGDVLGDPKATDAQKKAAQKLLEQLKKPHDKPPEKR
jgi:hypothetical protein